jgi:hypothetical protein
MVAERDNGYAYAFLARDGSVRTESGIQMAGMKRLMLGAASAASLWLLVSPAAAHIIQGQQGGFGSG